MKSPCPSFQVSDDEDDTHPNIDTPSLFKWRHEARVQRTQEFEEKKKITAQELNKYVPSWSSLKVQLEILYAINHYLAVAVRTNIRLPL